MRHELDSDVTADDHDHKIAKRNGQRRCVLQFPGTARLSGETFAAWKHEGRTTEETMLFEISELERVLRLQKQSYGLLKWLNQHLKSGSLSFSVVHRAIGGSAAAEDWLGRNKAHIPPALVPPASDYREFSYLLASYLFTSFTLPTDKVTERVADCHCFCDYCSYVVAIHRLVPRNPTAKDRQQAHALKRLFLGRLTEDLGYPLEKSLEEAVFSTKTLSLELSCATYAYQLIRRTEFASQGSAVLVLWRDIAWEDGRKPRKNFELTAARVVHSEQTLRSVLSALISGA